MTTITFVIVVLLCWTAGVYLDILFNICDAEHCLLGAPGSRFQVQLGIAGLAHAITRTHPHKPARARHTHAQHAPLTRHAARINTPHTALHAVRIAEPHITNHNLQPAARTRTPHNTQHASHTPPTTLHTQHTQAHTPHATHIALNPHSLPAC